MDFRWLALRIGPYGVVRHTFCFFQPGWEKQCRRGIARKKFRTSVSGLGFRRSILCCMSCFALPPIPAGSCPSPHHHSASNPFTAILLGLQSPASRPSLVFFAFSQNAAISSTLLVDYLLFSFPREFPCSFLFLNRFLCAVRSWLSLLWNAWKVPQGTQRTVHNNQSPWWFLPQMDPSWECLHSLPRTFIILRQIRFTLKPCSFCWPLSFHRNNVISNTSVAPLMLVFKNLIQILTTK